MRHTSFGRDSLRATEGWLSVRRLTHSLAPVGHRFRLLLLMAPALALTCTPPSAAQRTSVSHLLRGRSVQNSRTQHAEGTARPIAASPDIIWVKCPSEAQSLGAMCGKLPVPLERQHPQGRKIKIYFELYLHTNSGPAESAILANPGGPGASTTGLRAIALALFGGNLDQHDLLLIDDRGRGLSAPIDCEDLQHGTAPFAQAEADCAAQLGDTASRPSHPICLQQLS
jgi:hypothetical protein